MSDSRPGLKSALIGWGLLIAALVAGRLGAPRWLGVALAIAAATLFLARLSQRMLGRSLSHALTPAASAPPPPEPVPVDRFVPRLPPDEVTGYVAYTEWFSAEGTLLALLRDRFDEEPTRIAVIGFSGGYLARRMDASWPWSSEGAAAADIPLAPAVALGWLADLHAYYPDNAVSDSRTVLGALRVRADGYANGRSAALGLAEREYRIALNAGERPGWTESNERMDAFRAQRDLDPHETTDLLRAASRAGAILADTHLESADSD